MPPAPAVGREEGNSTLSNLLLLLVDPEFSHQTCWATFHLPPWASSETAAESRFILLLRHIHCLRRPLAVSFVFVFLSLIHNASDVTSESRTESANHHIGAKHRLSVYLI
ncbi:unnamed protein product [Pleuronectes platessa]|uniref:Uncharacterized protein n=1 Tax=Pleuronectes platessa TaxID=8262 RepID=A0A9N7U361_PLEPL|nr:unnamed protein product [Pleuronectes platessa]